MEISEKVAYLKGLAEGLNLDTESKEGKLIAAIIDVLDDMAEKFAEIDDELCDVEDGLDAVSDDLSDVEETLYFALDDDEDEDEDDEDIDDEDDDEDDISVSKRIFGFIRALLAILLVLILLVITLRVGEAGGYLKLDWLRNGLGSRVSFVNTLFPEPADSAAPTIPDVQ